MADFTPQQALAQRLINKFGGDFVFRQFNTTPGDANEPWNGPTDPRVGATEQTFKAVQVSPSDAQKLGVGFETDDLIKRSSAFLIVAGSATDMRPFNEVDTSEGSHKIAGVQRLSPDDVTDVLWFVGLER